MIERSDHGDIQVVLHSMRELTVAKQRAVCQCPFLCSVVYNITIGSTVLTLCEKTALTLGKQIVETVPELDEEGKRKKVVGWTPYMNQLIVAHVHRYGTKKDSLEVLAKDLGKTLITLRHHIYELRKWGMLNDRNKGS